MSINFDQINKEKLHYCPKKDVQRSESLMPSDNQTLYIHCELSMANILH